MRSEKARKAAAKHKRRPPSALRPASRRTRNVDKEGLLYLEWLKTLCCVACFFGEWRTWLAGDGPLPWNHSCVTEGAHIGGNSAAKAPNFHAVPLCIHHHRGGPYSEESMKKGFWAYWGIDPERLIKKLNLAFYSR